MILLQLTQRLILFSICRPYGLPQRAQLGLQRALLRFVRLDEVLSIILQTASEDSAQLSQLM